MGIVCGMPAGASGTEVLGLGLSEWPGLGKPHRKYPQQVYMSPIEYQPLKHCTAIWQGQESHLRDLKKEP